MTIQVICLLPYLFFPFHAKEIINGRVMEVSDGNTITVITDENEQYHIELAGIDCPELKQPFGTEAKHLLEKNLKGNKVEVFVEGKNRWGVRQAVVIPNHGNDPRLKLLAEGLAWTSEKNPNPELESLRVDARDHGKGLWKDNDPTPPWIFRRQQTMLSPKFR